MNNKILKISYGQLQDNNYISSYNDKYKIAAFINNNVKNTFLNSPNNDDISKTAIIFSINDNDIVGRSVIYGTTIKNYNKTIGAQSFGSIEVDNSQRGKGIGTQIARFSLNNNEYPIFICSLLSSQCLSIMRKKENDCTIFDFPQLIKIINTEAAFACRGIKGFPLKLLKALGNSIFKIASIPNILKLTNLKKTYSIKKEVSVPEWAGEMCLNDGHKYAEYHDTKWLQWNLTHNLSGEPEDIQSFYSIYKDEKPVGFFLTKQRLRRDIKNYKKMLIGTLCEWASIDKKLTEVDINLLATETFSKDCYYILTVSDNNETVKKLHKHGFISHGFMQMGFKDKLNQFPDMKDMSLWRIRFGCCNSILY